MALASVAWSAPDPVGSAASEPAWPARDPEAIHQESIEVLRQRIESLRREADSANRGMAAMQTQLREAEEERGNRELMVLALAVLGVIAIGVFLFERGRRRAAARRARERVSGLPGASRITPDVLIDVDSDFAPDLPAHPERPPVRRIGGPEEEVAATAAAAFEPFSSEPLLLAEPDRLDSTVASVARAAHPGVERAQLSADDLIDLDQQAEFFLALGEDEAAIDLLEAGLSGPSAGSPLPYLRLLAIHRRRNDHEAHQRVRARYEWRFEAAAPMWSDEAAPGRHLEDDPQAIRQIEAVWPDQAATMRLIESWLIPSGVPTAHFGIEALCELQFLYLQARAVADLGAKPLPDVDLLLPLATPNDVRSVVTEALPASGAGALESTTPDVDFELDFPSSDAPSSRR